MFALFALLAWQCYHVAASLAHTYRKPVQWHVCAATGRAYRHAWQVPVAAPATLHGSLTAAQAYSAAELAWFGHGR